MHSYKHAGSSSCCVYKYNRLHKDCWKSIYTVKIHFLHIDTFLHNPILINSFKTKVLCKRFATVYCHLTEKIPLKKIDDLIFFQNQFCFIRTFESFYWISARTLPLSGLFLFVWLTSTDRWVHATVAIASVTIFFCYIKQCPETFKLNDSMFN